MVKYVSGIPSSKAEFTNFWYSVSYIAEIVVLLTSAYETYTSENKPISNLLKSEENIQYILLAVNWFFSSPSISTLPPYGIYSFISVLLYLEKFLLPAIGLGSNSGLTQEITKFVDAYTSKLMTYAAYAELALMVRLSACVLIFHTDPFYQIIAFAVFLRARYDTSDSMRKAVKQWELGVDNALSHESCLVILKQSWVAAKALITKGLNIEVSD